MDCSMLGSIMGSPHFGKVPFECIVSLRIVETQKPPAPVESSD